MINHSTVDRFTQNHKHEASQWFERKCQSITVIEVMDLETVTMHSTLDLLVVDQQTGIVVLRATWLK